MEREELSNIVGGAVTATLVNALSRGINTVYDLGRALGSAIRRVTSGKICPL